MLAVFNPISMLGYSVDHKEYYLHLAIGLALAIPLSLLQLEFSVQQKSPQFSLMESSRAFWGLIKWNEGQQSTNIQPE
jgi:hypothetical protein